MQSLKICIGQVSDDPDIGRENQKVFDTMVLKYDMFVAIMGDMSHDDTPNNTTWLDSKQRRDVQEKNQSLREPYPK